MLPHSTWEKIPLFDSTSPFSYQDICLLSFEEKLFKTIFYTLPNSPPHNFFKIHPIHAFTIIGIAFVKITSVVKSMVIFSVLILFDRAAVSDTVGHTWNFLLFWLLSHCISSSFTGCPHHISLVLLNLTCLLMLSVPESNSWSSLVYLNSLGDSI